MAYTIHEKPGDLDEIEWRLIEKVLAGTIYIKVFENLRACKNEPTPADVAFGGKELDHLVNGGDTQINRRLRKSGAPFLFTRIGAWTHGSVRSERLLAFVRWNPTGHEAKS